LDAAAARRFGIPTLLLMENAGRSCADEVEHLLRPGQPVTVLCGRGNNGGDGLVIARHLAQRGCSVRVWLAAPRRTFKGDAAVNLAIAIKWGFPLRGPRPGDLSALLRFPKGGVIVDALLGTGLSGPARPEIANVISRVNTVRARERHVRVLAVDVPSGLSGDRGPQGGAVVKADVTVTFVAPKVGFQSAGARAVLGRVAVADIGIPLRLLRELDGPRRMPVSKKRKKR
jgi:NAD(P)H-hydrate epimerase